MTGPAAGPSRSKMAQSGSDCLRLRQHRDTPQQSATVNYG
jgi:hypothetical protein